MRRLIITYLIFAACISAQSGANPAQLNSTTLSELKDFHWYKSYDRPYYDSGILHVKKSLDLARLIQNDAIRYDMIYIIETYLKYFDYSRDDNSKTCKNMWWDCIRVINKYDFIPAKWPEMDLLIKKAIEYFELDDNR